MKCHQPVVYVSWQRCAEGNRTVELNSLFADAVPGPKTKGLHCLPAISAEYRRRRIKPSFRMKPLGIVKVGSGVAAGPLEKSNGGLLDGSGLVRVIFGWE